MDRVGLFREMGYVTINDKYKERGGKQIVYHWDAHLNLKCSHTHIYIFTIGLICKAINFCGFIVLYTNTPHLVLFDWKAHTVCFIALSTLLV